MSNSGIIALSDGVRAYFQLPFVVAMLASYGMTAPTVAPCDWRQRQQILNQGPGQANRVLFIPGTIDGAALGGMLPPRRSNGNPRVLVTWGRIVTASIWAVDTSNTNDGQLQIAAGDNLMELVIQAMVWTANADILLDHADVKRDPKVSANMTFGDERLVEFVHRSPFYGPPQQVVTGATPTVQRDPSS